MSRSPDGRGAKPPDQRALLLILALGALLRVIGLGWGLPGEAHVCSYHPDELPLMRSVAMMAQSHTWNPGFFNYGTLYIYLVALAARGMALIGLSPLQGAAGLLYLTGRLVSVAFGIGTIAMVYLIGRELGGRRLGLLAAMLLAAMPLHAVHSQYATVDITATFWFAVVLWACLRCLRSERGADWRWPVLAGVAVGLAAATKYTLAAAAVPLLVALASSRARWPVYPLVAVAAGAAFLAACPYAVLDWESFRQGVTLERQHAATLTTAAFMGTGSGWRYHLLRSLPMAMGTPVLVTALAGLVFLPFRHRRAGWLLPAAAAIIYAVVGYPRDHFMRYTIPLLPLLALSAGALLSGLGDRAASVRRAATGIAGLLVLWSLLLSAVQLSFLVGPAVQDRAAGWIEEQIPRGRQVALASWPWFYTPPIMKYQCGLASARQFAAEGERSRYRFAVLDWDARELLRHRPPYLVMADVEAMARGADKAKQTETFLNAVERHYRPWKSFPDRGMRRVAVKALSQAPPDWRYPSPVITIYRTRTQTPRQ